MSAEPGNARPAPPFRLQTLGTLALRGPAGEAPAADFAQQNRRLALLAALAASGARGRNRDQLLLFFWPDASQQRARHSLEQTLYLIRRSVDAEVFLGVNPLRLNPAVLGSDVEEFESAIGAGELEAAVELYPGPFLDGFYLTDAPEFEQWMEGERSRLEGLYLKTLERLAEAAESAGDRQAAIAWWRRLSDTDPLSSRYALGTMRALSRAGDHSAALRHARRHQELVEQELGASAGPEIAALAEEIRASAKEGAVPPPTGRRDREEVATVEPGSGPTAASRERESAEGRSPEEPDRRPARVRYAALVVSVLAVAVLTATWLRNEPTVPVSAEASGASIVVLPLANLSADPLDAALADGVTEELIAMLAKTRDLKVIASTSAFAFRDRQTDVRAIADSLHVANVLEGGVQKIGSRLRVQVRLVDARDGSTRWSETYDREIEDLFAVQEEIARAVARELGARLGVGTTPRLSRNRARNVAAYELYLRGSNTAVLRSDSAAREGMEYFRQAIAIDSTYAAAYAGLSRMYGRLTGTDYAEFPDREMQALAEEAAQKAIALDDLLAEGHGALAIVRMNAMDLASAEREFKRAIELDPNQARIREWLVHLYLRTERPAEALAEARRALEIDPLSPTAHAEVARTLVANGSYDEALVHLEHIADVQPPLLRTPGIAAQAYAGKEMWPEAIAALGCQPEAPVALCAFMFARGGRLDEALRLQATLLEQWRRGEARAFDVAIGYAGLGDLDQAFAWLDRSVDDHSLARSYTTIMDPIFEDLRADPRFDRVREQLRIQKR